MKIKSLLIIVFLAIFFLTPQSVSAHVLKTDGSIGAILHMDPDDEPIARSQTGFFFEFKDKEGKFTPQGCECTFSIVEDGKELFTQSLFQNNTDPSLNSASVYFTFPEKNVYQIKVIGKPNTPNAFQSFTLVYDVRVDKEVVNSTTAATSSPNWFSTHIIHLVGGFIVLAFLVFALVKQSRKPKTS